MRKLRACYVVSYYLRLYGEAAASSRFPSSSLLSQCYTQMLRVIAIVLSMVLPKNRGIFAVLPNLSFI
ncbi:unnamed protein product [Taenia asiatica]|uniref:Secreted protein n=1 Tax=Taenia asiatica TaxID=60517 RepID=A0A0R3W5S8_TAEAS|nr:unnamed protein product [Taenia asiatica]